jgi:fused signal recognition particle receptor
MSLFERFKQGLARSRAGFIRHLDNIFKEGEINDEFYEDVEEALITGDVGVETSLKLIKQLREAVSRDYVRERSEARELLVEIISAVLAAPDQEPDPEEPPLVILLIGVNGSGKTTTAAKLAYRYRCQGQKTLLVAGDTFRAAAIDQLAIWAGRAEVDLVRQQPGSDSSAVFYDAINAAKARQARVVIGDTAGRLHTKVNLMEELVCILKWNFENAGPSFFFRAKIRFNIPQLTLFYRWPDQYPYLQPMGKAFQKLSLSPG